MRVSSDKKNYWDEYHDTDKMYAMGLFLRLTPVEEALQWIKNPEGIAIETEETSANVENGVVKVYRDFFDFSEDEQSYYYKNAFTTTVETMKIILEKWKIILDKKPTFVILKKVADDIIFQEDYRDDIELDFSQAKLTQLALNHLLEPTIKNELFYGGYHLRNSSQNLEMSNQLVGDANVMSFDIKFAKDFTFNHVFFPSSWNENKLREEIIHLFEEERAKDMEVITKCFNKRGTFFILDRPSEEFVWMRLIFNEKLEVVTCYPIFRK